MARTLYTVHRGQDGDDEVSDDLTGVGRHRPRAAF